MNKLYINFNCATLSVDQLNNCMENLGAAESNHIYFLFAANAAHLALVSSLTAVLTQSDRCGAFNRKIAENYSKSTKEPPKDGFQEYRVRLQKNEQKFLNEEEKELTPLNLSVQSLRDMIENAKQIPDDGSRRGLPLKLTHEEESMIHQLIYIRGHVEHPKPLSIWSLTSDYVIEPIAVAVKVVAKLMDEIDSLESYRRKQAAEVAQEIEQTCMRLMSGKA